MISGRLKDWKFPRSQNRDRGHPAVRLDEAG